jgi:hypothetical protein
VEEDLRLWEEEPLTEGVGLLTEGVDAVAPARTTKYLSYRFTGLDIDTVTVDNYENLMRPSLAEQVSMFIPPSGSFKTPDLRRYLELLKTYETSTNDLILGFSLADQIRVTFSDMKPATICEKFPDIDLVTKRRYRCVAEYLIRQGELTKVKDQNGKLVKKIGNMGKAVVIYEPLPKIRQTLQRSGLAEYIKNDQPTQEATVETQPGKPNAGGENPDSADD